MLEQIGVQELKDETLMFSETDIFEQPHDVVAIIWVLLHQERQKLRLLLSELVVQLGVSVDLDRNFLLGHVVYAGDDLSERAFSENSQYFVAE